MKQFVGLRSKMYSTLVNKIDGRSINIKNVKGIKKHVVKNKIRHEQYIQCLLENCEITIKQNLIQSKLHNVYTATQTKIALSPHDNKRYLSPNSFKTLSWGHKDVPET